ncbi:MAG: hypothetical protein SF066_10940 [Thermoanaerobaculia bacterium]|nr:hypothetical protein [Thermoanaerobaculia bacterium]
MSSRFQSRAGGFAGLLLTASLASAQGIPPTPGAVYSPYIEKPSNPKHYIFTQYAGGAPEGSYYYALPTNYVSQQRNYVGECVHYNAALGRDLEIQENVVMYRGTNTVAALNAGTDFTAVRIAAPCFDGRSGEVSEQANITASYGGGDLNWSAAKNKFYVLMNRTRGRIITGTNGQPEFTCCSWAAGDFTEVFIGAKETLASAASAPTSPSTRCRGHIVPTSDPEYCASQAFAWKLAPLVKKSVIGGVTYTTLTPVVSEVNAATASLPIFQNLPVGSVLFGFMRFGVGASGGFPDRIAAVAITDSSTTTRPTAAVLYYKVGSAWVAATGGTMPSVPTNFASSLPGMSVPGGDINDLEWDPVLAKWFLYGTRGVTNPTTGCNDGAAATGGELVKVDLLASPPALAGFWPSKNELGRLSADAYFLGGQEFIFYSSTDNRCATDPTYQTTRDWFGMEVIVRNKATGAPN